MKRVLYIIVCLIIGATIYVYGDSAAILIVALSISAASILQLFESAFDKAEKEVWCFKKAEAFRKRADFCGHAVVFFMCTTAITIVARFFFM